MARVTVEDCVTKIPNRFELVMMASQRARKIAAGEALLVERDNDKNPVVALREIADGAIDLKELEEGLIQGLQKYVEMDAPEDEEDLDLVALQQALTEERDAGPVTASKSASKDKEKYSGEDEADAKNVAGDTVADESNAPEKGEKEA